VDVTVGAYFPVAVPRAATTPATYARTNVGTPEQASSLIANYVDARRSSPRRRVVGLVKTINGYHRHLDHDTCRFDNRYGQDTGL
jgi:hypothetical protein